MTVHYDPAAPGVARVPVNATTCGRVAGEGDTATAATFWVTCPRCRRTIQENQ